MTVLSTPTSVAPPDPIAGTGVGFRRWRGLDEIPGMAAANNQLRERCGILELIDVPGMVHRYTHLVHSDPREDCIVIEQNGVTAGYARMAWHDLADGDRLYDATLLVAPAIWGTGAAASAVAWLEARAAEVAAANPTRRRAFIGHYLFGGDTESEAALGATGYEACRWEAELPRPDLEHTGPELGPDGYEIRTPTVEELPAVFAMYVAGFREHWGQYEDGEQRIEEYVDSPHFRRELEVVVFHGADPASAVSNQLEPQPDGSIRGLLDAVATHPDHRRLGLARAAINHSLRLLRDHGAANAYLGVDTGNHNRAMELYQSCGFRLASSGTNYRKPFSGGAS
jgi:ribosomal protein S18 acetylase RimI-like enzyme